MRRGNYFTPAVKTRTPPNAPTPLIRKHLTNIVSLQIMGAVGRPHRAQQVLGFVTLTGSGEV